MTEKQAVRLNRWQADGILLLTAAVWGGGFTAQRVAAQHMGPLMINGIRFLLAAAFLLPIVRFQLKIPARNLPGVILAGIFLSLASNLQQLGLHYTTAGNAGFITGLYVILVPIFLWIFWRELIRWPIFTAAGMATMGMFFINSGGAFKFTVGDLYELFGVVFWAMHVIIIGIMVRRMDVLSFSIGQFAICGILNLSFGLLIEPHQLSSIHASGWALLYAGIISGGIGYTFQALGQKFSPSSDAALILSLEAVFAAMFGFVFLHERASTPQLFGYGLILAAVILAQFFRPVKSDYLENNKQSLSNAQDQL
ncbi:MAG TPA: DMT family transporter [Longilinea sp.]|nr:DMT family transporter [Longilinea sp.]